MNMRIFKEGLVVLSIYLFAVFCSFLITSRVHELDSEKNYSKVNESLAINFSK